MTSGLASSSRSFAPGSAARISAEPTRTASAPASSAAAAWARDSIPLSATTTLFDLETVCCKVALATRSSWALRSIRNVERSRALIPIGSAPSSIARSSSSAECASTSVSRPSSWAPAISRVAARSSRSRSRSRTASAPSLISSSSSPGWRKKPFARSGSLVAARAAARSSVEPPKRWSTRTEIAAAPAVSSCRES